MTSIPVSVVIPTRDRPTALRRTIESLLASTAVPREFVIVDATEGTATADAVRSLFADRADAPRLIVQVATRVGAAAQRNQAMALATQEHVLFCDDDIVCEPDCIERLWRALQADSAIGGANATIVNQSYVRPGLALRLVLTVLGARERNSYAGRVVGPAIHFLPRDSGAGEPVPVEWLNTTCTLYRRAVLPDPPFDAFFTGYSLREDLALSLRVAAKARLVNVPAARIVHDSQPGAHKADVAALARMDVVNRHYVMTEVMNKRRSADIAALLMWELGQLAMAAIRQRGGAAFRQSLRGKGRAACDIAWRRKAGKAA